MTLNIPSSTAEITPDWLTAALGADVLQGAQVTAADVTSLSEGIGFIGEVARVELTYDDAPDTAPSTLIAKMPIADPGGRMIGQMLRLYEREANFYEHMASELKIRVPRCFHNAADVEAVQFCLLLEDLGGLATIDQRDGADFEQAASILRTIASFHARWDGGRGDKFDWLPRMNDPMMIGFADRYDDAHAALLEAIPDKVDPQMDANTARLAPHRVALADQVAALPSGVTHGDFRLDNMFFDGDDVVLFDWQALGRGSPLVDVVYFISTNVDAEVIRTRHTDLLDVWRETFGAEGGRDVSLDEAMSTCQLVWGFFGILGTVLLSELDFSSAPAQSLFDGIYSRAIAATAAFDTYSLTV